MKSKLFSSSFESPLGKILIAASNDGICLAEFCDETNSASQLNKLVTFLKATIADEENLYITQLKKELHEYFSGNLVSFTIPLYLVGTDFQKSVWNELLQIPFGETRTYKEQSIALNNLVAIRAVANANGLNRIAIVVPCHRVIGSNGKLTGYSGGLWRKKWLLNFEMEYAKSIQTKDLFSLS